MLVLLSLIVAIFAAAAALAAAGFLAYEMKLGDVGILLMYLAPAAAGVWVFIIAFRRLRTYIST